MGSHQQAQYHFMPQDARGEKAAHQFYQLPQQSPLPTDYYASSGAPTREANTVPIKRSIALTFLVLFAILFICVIGLGAGLGISQRNLSQTKSDLQFAQQAVSAVAAATTVYTTIKPTATGTSPAASATPKSDVQCPSINGTIYTAALTKNSTNSTTTTTTTTTATGPQKFRLMCGFDYGQGEAIDIGNVKTKNLEACADACAAKANCTGAGWGVIEGDKGVEHTCWMKKNLTKAHKATGDWGFALLVQRDAE